MFSLIRGRQMHSNGPSARPVSPMPPRQRVGPYRLCVELASGGMATVYLARREADHGPASMLAVKLIHPHLANDSTFLEMFTDEAELASRIRHANVCTVLDYDLCEEESYIVMEYLIGESLLSVWRQIARTPTLDPGRLAACVARILADACEGLHAAHELTDADGDPLHVVHRDVSPENVFVTYDGVAKVMDFGVALAAHRRHRTQTGVVKGKFASIAPECLTGDKPDRRADVWGIGVIAWELLTGERLFKRHSDLETLQAVQEAPIRRPSDVRDASPRELDDIVMRALERDPARRYATARELGRELARFAARDGQVVTSADVADWLRELLPGGRERRQQMLEIAAQLGTDSDPSVRRRVDALGETRVTAESAQLAAEPRAAAPDTRRTSAWAVAGASPVAPSMPTVGVVDAARVAASAPAWLVGIAVFAIAAAGALSALLAQALLRVESVHESPRLPGESAAPAPAANPPDSVPGSAASAARGAEIILRVVVERPQAEPPVVAIAGVMPDRRPITVGLMPGTSVTGSRAGASTRGRPPASPAVELADDAVGALPE